jgi:hypothetical protein
VDLTVYLPDALGQRAKEAKLNFSRMLRDAVTDELERQSTVDTTLESPEVYERDLKSKNGNIYTGRITGKLIASDEKRGVEVFLTHDERLLALDGRNLQVDEIDDKDLGDWLGADGHIQAAEALGLKATVDL